MRPWRAAVTVVFLAQSACYPIFKQLQPDAHFTVVRDGGEALPDVPVTLISSTYPYGHERSRETHRTDAHGVATFSERREWRVELLMIHGAEEFFWNVCVEAPGFETFQTQWSNGASFEPALRVELAAGASTPCDPPPP